MDLIQKAVSLGFIPINKDYYLWKIQKWLREIHKIDITIFSNASGYHWELNKSFHKDWFSGGTHISDDDLKGPNNGGGWNTYEEALEQGLIEALKLIKI